MSENPKPPPFRSILATSSTFAVQTKVALGASHLDWRNICAKICQNRIIEHTLDVLHCQQGKDGEFVLYEYTGDEYDYEKGKRISSGITIAGKSHAKPCIAPIEL